MSTRPHIAIRAYGNGPILDATLRIWLVDQHEQGAQQGFEQAGTGTLACDGSFGLPTLRSCLAFRFGAFHLRLDAGQQGPCGLWSGTAELPQLLTPRSLPTFSGDVVSIRTLIRGDFDGFGMVHRAL